MKKSAIKKIISSDSQNILKHKKESILVYTFKKLLYKIFTS